jgi:hypothetical protein
MCVQCAIEPAAITATMNKAMRIENTPKIVYFFKIGWGMGTSCDPQSFIG